MCQTLLTLVFGTLVLHASGIQVAVDTYDAHCGLNNGWATAFATGGNSPYSYSWSNGASTAHIQDLAPGSYTVTVTDAVNATAQSTVTIVNIPNIDPEVVPRPACTAYGSCSGQVFVSPLDLGTAPYTYTVDPPQCTIWPPTPYLPGGVFIDYLESGQNYTITVTDANGCTGSRSAFITEIPPYQHVAAAITAECGGSGNGGFTIADLGIPVLWHVTGPNGFMGNFDYSNTPGPYVFSDLVGGEYTATPVDPWQTPNAFWCEFPAVVTVPGLLPPCGSVSGHVFHDADQDCAFNGSDIDLPYKVLTIEPGPSYVLTDANGNYHQNLDFGSYSIEQSLQQEVQLCPGNTPVPFISDGLSPDAVVDFADSSMVPHDVSVSVFAYVPRVGSPTAVHVLVKNNSAYPSGSLDVSLAYDPLLLNPSPFPAQWSIPVLAPYADTLLYFHAEVPNDVNLIGTAILYTATVTNSVNEPITTNNSDSQSEVIVASFDPNDKHARTSSRSSDAFYYLDVDDHIDYTIRFQNTGTASALTVILRDTLDADLDIARLEIIGASHDFVPSIADDRVLVFTFSNIDLPDSASDPLGSQGSVRFRIRPRDVLTVGEVISNTANIYFDSNPPVITEPSVLVVEQGTDLPNEPALSLMLQPNPASDHIVLIGTQALFMVRLLATDGRCVQQQRVRGSKADLSIGHLVGGTYVVEAHTEQGEVIRARFVKN